MEKPLERFFNYGRNFLPTRDAKIGSQLLCILSYKKKEMIGKVNVIQTQKEGEGIVSCLSRLLRQGICLVRQELEEWILSSFLSRKC